MISVVTNLIDNAVKASRKESKIVLEATPDHLMVQDFGKGIPKEDLEMVTEPFYMVDKSRSRAKGSVAFYCLIHALKGRCRKRRPLVLSLCNYYNTVSVTVQR